MRIIILVEESWFGQVNRLFPQDTWKLSPWVLDSEARSSDIMSDDTVAVLGGIDRRVLESAVEQWE